MKVDLTPFNGRCSCGKEHSILVRDLVLESGALEKLPFLLQKETYKDCSQPVVICDENTYQAAGKTVGDLLKCPVICLSAEGLHADENAVASVQKQMPQNTGVLLAVGSGTIHDITRYTAAQKKIPFLSVPTAASVDGFVSTVAAMTWHGFKKSFSSVSPIAVVADSSVFSKAPYRLTASGVSDLLGKYTALADWEISNAVTGEWICRRICQMERDAIHKVKESLAGLRQGKLEAYEELMYALLLSGLAMQMVGNSRPASGAEHHLSHLWEMEVINPHIDAYHGEKVSVGLVKACGVYQQILEAIDRGACRVKDYHGLSKEELRPFEEKGFLEEILQENTPDPLSLVDVKKLRDSLPQIAEILRCVPAQEEIIRLIQEAGGVSKMEEIGLPDTLTEESLRLSPYIRRRLTLMRLRKLLITQ